MSAQPISMHEFVATLRRRVPLEIHPLAQLHVNEWLTEMEIASEHADMGEVARLNTIIINKITDELRWEAVKYASVDDFKEAHRLRRRAERWEQVR